MLLTTPNYYLVVALGMSVLEKVRQQLKHIIAKCNTSWPGWSTMWLLLNQDKAQEVNLFYTAITISQRYANPPGQMKQHIPCVWRSSGYALSICSRKRAGQIAHQPIVLTHIHEAQERPVHCMCKDIKGVEGHQLAMLRCHLWLCFSGWIKWLLPSVAHTKRNMLHWR